MDLQPEAPKLIEAEEEEPYTFENMPVCISIDNSTVAVNATLMDVTPDGFTFQLQKGQDDWFTIYTSFAKTNSVGINCDNLLVFVGDEFVEEEEAVPEIISTISDAAAGGSVQLTGHCFTVSIDFKKYGKNVLKQVHDIMVNYMGDADDHASRYDEDEDMEKMISADDIDEEGNIIDRREGQEEWEQEEQEEGGMKGGEQ